MSAAWQANCTSIPANPASVKAWRNASMTVTMSFTGLTEPMMAGPHTSIFSGYVSKECVFRPDRFRAPGWCSTGWMSSITKPSGAPTKQSILSVQTLSMAIIGFSRSTIMTRTIPLIHQKNIWIDTLTTWTSCLCLTTIRANWATSLCSKRWTIREPTTITTPTMRQSSLMK